ncbi:MAG: sigma-70 family RNA polymerase sigma factor, partial [Bacilli bacterium]|nr:sigma-70 family RNA polymerase sigma factor [Bacilli bacterium]
ANWVIREFFKNIPLPKDEVQALALEGLSKAINRFDYTRGYNFSSYATKMMMTNIMRHFKDIMGISWVNYWMKRNIAYWREELANYDTERTTPYTPQELADSGLVKYTAAQIANMDDSVDIIYNFSDYYELPDAPPDDMLVIQEDYDFIDELEDMMEDSIDQEENDEEFYVPLANDMPVTQEDYDFIDALEDMMGVPNDQKEAERELYFPFMKEALYDVLGELTERDQKVLSLRFGLEDGQERTLEEVGKEFFLTRNRIREIEAKALRRLRHPPRMAKLREYAEEFMTPKRRIAIVTTDECIEAFMRLYEFRNTNFSYKAKAFFISKRNLEIDEQEARNLDMIIDVFITNISLGYACCYRLNYIIDEFVGFFGSDYRYKYPYDSIYRAFENKIKEEERQQFSEETKKTLMEKPENLIRLVLSNRC